MRDVLATRSRNCPCPLARPRKAEFQANGLNKARQPWGQPMKKVAELQSPSIIASILLLGAFTIGAITIVPTASRADEGGVSMWVPGFFGSLAAAPQVPGFAFGNVFIHPSIAAGADVA